MKKLLILVAAVAMTAAANAAAFAWSAANIYGPSGAKLSGATAYIYCDALSSDALASAITTSSGAISSSTSTFDVASAVAGTAYDFYFVITTTYDAKEYSYTSAVKSATAQDVGQTSITFGNLSSATQAAGAWTAAAVPEPTSGLLLLLGMAGLALKRKRA